MRTYFSVDVETSGLIPNEVGSHLLSLGAVAVSQDGWVIDTFYARINAPLPNAWFLPPDHQSIIDTPNKTLQFWKGVEAEAPFAANEAYADRWVPRRALPPVAETFSNWVMQYGTDWEDRIFVANPVSFDHAWIIDMMRRAGVTNPFHYRTLCLRSMAFGAAGNKSDWQDSHLRTHRPKHPHHPLSDAYAQAQDLITLLGRSAQLDPLDEPYYENEPS